MRRGKMGPHQPRRSPCKSYLPIAGRKILDCRGFFIIFSKLNHEVKLNSISH
jgi:hypothetical protein